MFRVVVVICLAFIHLNVAQQPWGRCCGGQGPQGCPMMRQWISDHPMSESKTQSKLHLFDKRDTRHSHDTV